jgi:integration host factor subunit alpha
MALTKTDIIDNLQNELDYPRKKCIEIVEILLEIIKRTLEGGEEVLISGFGKFCVTEKKARKGRNPATGKDMLLEKRRVITFKCSSVLRNYISGQ